jgi:hypothetical protein
MRKKEKTQDQLDLFQGVKKGVPNIPNNFEPETLRGKQVFLDNRQRIYEKILNRKME